MKRGLVVTLCIALVSLAAIQLVGTEVYRYFFYEPASNGTPFMTNDEEKTNVKFKKDKQQWQLLTLMQKWATSPTWY